MTLCFSCQFALSTGEFCHTCGSRIIWHGWAIVRELGSGGSGAAYLVERQGKRAVLKIPNSSVSLREHQVEARNLYLAASLDVAPTPIETAPDGLLMDYLPTPTGMDIRERAKMFLGAVNRLHNRDLVHRDIKPENVVGWQLIDLGSMVDLVRDTKVRPVGTPGYAAPEAYRKQISPKLDAYACGWVLVEWLSGPEPNDPPHFGFPAGWSAGAWWDALLKGLLEEDPSKRLSVGMAYHRLVGDWCRLQGGTRIGSDLVTISQWQSVLPDIPCRDTLGYATELDPSDVQRYLDATGTRLPSVAELDELGVGTEHQSCLRPPERMLSEGLVSDVGARNCRRFLWQSTDGPIVWGGTSYADSESMKEPTVPNGMVGLRVAN